MLRRNPFYFSPNAAKRAVTWLRCDAVDVQPEHVIEDKPLVTFLAEKECVCESHRVVLVRLEGGSRKNVSPQPRLCTFSAPYYVSPLCYE